MESKKNKRALYLEHLEKQKKSGMTAPKYCQLTGISLHTLRYHRLRQKRAKKQNPFAEVQLTPQILLRSHVYL